MKRERKRIRGKENWRGREGEERKEREEQQLCSHTEAVLAEKGMQ